MAELNDRPDESAKARADAMALAEQAEAEAAEAEAVAAAARARARAIRLRQEAKAKAGREGSPDPRDAESPQPADSQEVQVVDKGVPVQEEPDTEATGESGESIDAQESDEPPASSPKPVERRRRLHAPRVSTILEAAAIVVIYGLFGVSGYMVWHHHGAVEQRERTAAFIAAAKQGVINMTTFDFTKAKADIQRVLDSSTGEFRDDFQKRAGDFTSAVEQSKVVIEGTVNSAAVESMGKDSAVVLVSATSHVTNPAGAKEEPRARRLKVTVARDGDQIKMSKLEFLP